MTFNKMRHFNWELTENAELDGQFDMPILRPVREAAIGKLLWSDCCQGSRYLTLSIFYVRDFHLLFPHPSSWFFPNRRSGSICKESQFNSSRHWPLCYTWIGYRQANGFRREPCYLKSWITSMRCQHSFNAHCSNLTVITTPCRCRQISMCIIPFLFQSALTIDVSMAVSLVH